MMSRAFTLINFKIPVKILLERSASPLLRTSVAGIGTFQNKTESDSEFILKIKTESESKCEA